MFAVLTQFIDYVRDVHTFIVYTGRLTSSGRSQFIGLRPGRPGRKIQHKKTSKEPGAIFSRGRVIDHDANRYQEICQDKDQWHQGEKLHPVDTLPAFAYLTSPKYRDRCRVSQNSDGI